MSNTPDNSDWSKVIVLVTGMGDNPYPDTCDWHGLRPHLQQYIDAGWKVYEISHRDLTQRLAAGILPAPLMEAKQVIIIGHSWGGWASWMLVEALFRAGRTVLGWMVLDGVTPPIGWGQTWIVAPNVLHAASYRGWGAALEGLVVEADVRDLGCGHTSFFTRPDVLAKLSEWINLIGAA